jgi:hypothetical protein
MTVYPTGHQLVHRHIPADDRCIFYGQIERVEQLLLFCPFARRVWEGVKSAFPLHLLRKELHNMKQWMFEFLKRESKVNATVLAVTAWHIWEARNDVRNNEVQVSVSRVVSRTLAYVEMILKHLWKDPAALKPPQILSDSGRLLPLWARCASMSTRLFS